MFRILYRKTRRFAYLSWMTGLAVLVFLFGVLTQGWFFSGHSVDALSEQETYRVFVYGTLTNQMIRWVVTQKNLATQPAELLDFQKDGLDIHAMKGAKTPGLVLVVNADTFRKLDRYERLGERYHRFQVQLADGSWAWVYQRIEGEAS